MLALLAALAWAAPAQHVAGPVSFVQVSQATALVPSQDDPGAPEPVVPQPPPPLYPPEVSGGPDLVPPGMSGPGGTTPLPGQGDAGLSASEPALVAPIEQPDAQEPETSPFSVPGSSIAGVAPFALPGSSPPGSSLPGSSQTGYSQTGSTQRGVEPFTQSVPPVDPAKAPSACPDHVAPGEVLPPAIWSVCPGGQQQTWSYSPFLTAPDQQQPSATTPSAAPGALQVQIPSIAGLGSDDAQRTLTMSGLNVGEVTEEPSTSPPGTVLRTNPPFGSAVEFGRAVDLVVAGR